MNPHSKRPVSLASAFSTFWSNRRLVRDLTWREISGRYDRPVKTYSSRMFVCLAFALIANVQADVLVVDEALAVGDVFFAQKCMRFLRQFQDAGGTLVFVSHSSAAVLSLCRRAIWLEMGRVVMDGSAKEVCEAYQARSYGMQVAGRAADPGIGHEATMPVAEITDSNSIRVFRFNAAAASFGDGRARISSVVLVSRDGRPLFQIQGGDNVRLRVEAEVHADLDSPVVGFFLKDDRIGDQHDFYWPGGLAV